jgi:hypothetical protein
MTKRKKVPIPQTTDGQIGYIAASIDSMHDQIESIGDSLGDVKLTMVTKDHCRDRRIRILDSVGKPAPEDITGVNEIPTRESLDIWSWCQKRFPVILMLVAFIGGMGVVYKLYLDAKTMVERQEKEKPAPPKTKIVSIPVHHYHFFKPDAGTRRKTTPRRRRRPRRKTP